MATACNGDRAAGVSWSIDDPQGVTTFYLIDGFPSSTATATDTSGEMGFINVPVRSTLLTVSAGGQPLATINALVRKDAVTLVSYRP